MTTYKEDLRKRSVEAIEKGTGKSEVARTIGVGLSSASPASWPSKSLRLLR